MNDKTSKADNAAAADEKAKKAEADNAAAADKKAEADNAAAADKKAEADNAAVEKAESDFDGRREVINNSKAPQGIRAGLGRATKFLKPGQSASIVFESAAAVGKAARINGIKVLRPSRAGSDDAPSGGATSAAAGSGKAAQTSRAGGRATSSKK